MKKSLLLFLSIASFCISISAQEVSFVQNKTWKQILELARQKNMPIFFDAYASWCGPCKYMESDVYTNEAVALFYNANFINVKMDMEKGEGVQLSDEFEIGSYPTFLFIMPDGKIIHRSVGAMEPADFIELGKDARNPDKQYYTLKAKAQSGKLSDAAFAEWAAAAKRLDDEDRKGIVSAFLASKNNILVNEYTATVALKYADSLTDAQMRYLVNNEARIAQLLNLSRRDAAGAVYNKLFSLALKQYTQKNSKDAFAAVIRKYDAARVNLAVKDLEFRIAMFIDEDTKKAAGLLMNYLTASAPLSLEQVAGIMMDNLSDFEDSDFTPMAEKLAAYQTVQKDKGMEAWLYLMQMVCYYKMDKKSLSEEYGKKAYRQGGLPEEYMKMLKSMFAIE